MDITPDRYQEKAIEFLVQAILERKKTVALLGAGGTGKSSILKFLLEQKEIADIDISFTATTNKAVNVMKADIKEAMTLHKAISKHVPTKMYAELEMFFNLYDTGELDDKYEFSDDIKKFLKEINLKEEDVTKFNNEKELIAEFGVSPYDNRIFSHWATGEYVGGVCVIDESSMLPTKSQYNNEMKLKSIGLDKVQDIYDTVILVGDGSQLPPINGESSFENVEQYVLNKNYRSNKELLKVLNDARNGRNPHDFKSNKSVRIMSFLDDNYYDAKTLIKKDVAHIVYTNKTRKYITQKIRGEDSHPNNNERIVYKGANINDEENGNIISKNEVGYYKDGFGIWEKHKQIVQARHFDEYNDGYCYLQYGYAITAHMAQGSAFDYVIVHYDDVPHFIDRETKTKWLYTALSRARLGIILVV